MTWINSLPGIVTGVVVGLLLGVGIGAMGMAFAWGWHDDAQRRAMNGSNPTKHPNMGGS